MDKSLPFFVGYSEKRAGWPVHSEADVFVYLGGVSGCDCLHFLMTIGEIRILSLSWGHQMACVFCPFEDSFFSESSSNAVSYGHCWRRLVFADFLAPCYDVRG